MQAPSSRPSSASSSGSSGIAARLLSQASSLLQAVVGRRSASPTSKSGSSSPSNQGSPHEPSTQLLQQAAGLAATQLPPTCVEGSTALQVPSLAAVTHLRPVAPEAHSLQAPGQHGQGLQMRPLYRALASAVQADAAARQPGRCAALPQHSPAIAALHATAAQQSTGPVAAAPQQLLSVAPLFMQAAGPLAARPAARQPPSAVPQQGSLQASALSPALSAAQRTHGPLTHPVQPMKPLQAHLPGAGPGSPAVQQPRSPAVGPQLGSWTDLLRSPSLSRHGASRPEGSQTWLRRATCLAISHSCLQRISLLPPTHALASGVLACSAHTSRRCCRERGSGERHPPAHHSQMSCWGPQTPPHLPPLARCVQLACPVMQQHCQLLAALCRTCCLDARPGCPCCRTCSQLWPGWLNPALPMDWLLPDWLAPACGPCQARQHELAVQGVHSQAAHEWDIALLTLVRCQGWSEGLPDLSPFLAGAPLPANLAASSSALRRERAASRSLGEPGSSTGTARRSSVQVRACIMLTPPAAGDGSQVSHCHLRELHAPAACQACQRHEAHGHPWPWQAQARSTDTDGSVVLHVWLATAGCRPCCASHAEALHLTSACRTQALCLCQRWRRSWPFPAPVQRSRRT